MKFLILDDELHSRIAVKSYLERFMETSYTLKEAGTINEAIAVIKDFHPDVAFLDIDLNGGTSFDFLAHLPEINFRIVFITSFNEFAVKAFRFNATDYILKPIVPNEFEEALHKATGSLPSTKKEIDKLIEDLDSGTIERLILKDFNSIHFVKIQYIIYCQSENNYTTFYLSDGKEITVSKTIGGYEKTLRPVGFFRSHRSYLINLKKVKSFDKSEGGGIRMENEIIIPVARNKRETFMKIMGISS